MEAFEKLILIRFFITDYFHVLDLNIDEFSAFTVSSIKQNLIDKYYDPYGDNRSIESVLLEFSKTNNDEDFVKLFYDLMRYLVMSPKLTASKNQQMLEQCKAILTKYIAPSFVVFKDFEYQRINDYINKANYQILQNNFDEAISTARNIVEGVFVYGLKEKGLSDSEISSKRANRKALKIEFEKLYNLDPQKHIKNHSWQALAGSVLGVFDSICDIRNNYGTAHFQPTASDIQKYHAEFAVNAATSLALFLLGVIKNNLNKNQAFQQNFKLPPA